MRYYLRTDSGEHGPLSQDEVVRLIEREGIRCAEVSQDGGAWQDIRSIRAFREALPTERPAAPKDARFQTVSAARQTASRLLR